MTLDEPSDSEQPETRPTGDAPASSGLSLWPGLLIAMLGGQMLLMLVMVYKATTDRSFAVEPDYYQKALNWDEGAARRRASAALGWTAQVSVAETADIYKNRDVTCVLADKSGSPISDASVSMIAFSHARGSERLTLEFQALGSGQYTSRTRIARPGLWEFRIAAQRGTDTLLKIQQLRVVPFGESR